MVSLETPIFIECKNVKKFVTLLDTRRYPMGKNCPFKKTDPANGKLFQSQRSPLTTLSNGRTYPFEEQKFPFVESIWRRKGKISRLLDLSPTRICLRKIIFRLWEIIFHWRETIFVNKNHFRTWYNPFNGRNFSL